jgi:hypothetical protein
VKTALDKALDKEQKHLAALNEARAVVKAERKREQGIWLRRIAEMAHKQAIPWQAIRDAMLGKKRPKVIDAPAKRAKKYGKPMGAAARKKLSEMMKRRRRTVLYRKSATEEWTGTGAPPAWVKAIRARGGSIEKYRLAKPIIRKETVKNPPPKKAAPKRATAKKAAAPVAPAKEAQEQEAA